MLFIDLSGTELTADERELLASRRFSGLCLFGRNIRDRFQLADYIAEVRQLAGADFAVGIDQEGGGVLRLLDVPYPPPAMALGAADDTVLTRAVAAAAARGLRSTGVNIDFAPVADVNVNPLNPVIADRSFGADPELVARHVSAFIQGLQSEGVAASAKHFPGHGDVAVDSHLALPRLDRSTAELNRLELLPFRAAVQAGVASVMTAHIVFPQLDPDLPATLSPVVIRTLLRDGLGFDGVVFSDAMDMKAIADNFDPVEANVLALLAGVDAPLNIGPAGHHLAIADGVERALAEGRLDRAAVERSRDRLATLTTAFPPVAGQPEAAWGEGDAELLEGAAQRGLVALGELPVIRGSLTVVTPTAVWRSAASQEQVGPGVDLIAELKREGFRVEEVMFDPERLSETGYADGLLALVQPGPVVYASARRTPLSEAEVSFVHEVAGLAGDDFLHVALWNPYHARELPGPALLAFGYRPASLRAVVAALRGAPVTGVLPF